LNVNGKFAKYKLVGSCSCCCTENFHNLFIKIFYDREEKRKDEKSIISKIMENFYVFRLATFFTFWFLILAKILATNSLFEMKRCLKRVVEVFYRGKGRESRKK
jgi:hypothetical protein